MNAFETSVRSLGQVKKKGEYMLEVACPFPIAYLSERRVCASLDDIWEAAYVWCRVQGFKKEHGKFQGAPPI